jgi:hypothetical protein
MLEDHSDEQSIVQGQNAVCTVQVSSQAIASSKLRMLDGDVGMRVR